MPRFLNPITVTVPSGTAPFIVNSSTQVNNLNSDYLDGYHGSHYLDTSGTSQTKSGNLAIGGDLFAAKTVQAGYNRIKVFDYNFNGTPTNGVRIATTIPQTVAIGMYTLIFEGYRYGDAAPEMWTVSFYIYFSGASTVFYSYGASVHGTHVPGLQLGFVGGYVNIFLTDKIYYRRFSIRAVAGGMSETAGHFFGWTASDETPAQAGATGIVTPTFYNRFGYVDVGNVLTVSGALNANGGLSATTGTFSGAVQVNNDSGIRVAYNGTEYAWLRGYGLEFERSTSYLRPTTNRFANLWVGGAAINEQDWANIDFYSSNRFHINNNAIIHAGNYTSYPFVYGDNTTGSVNTFTGEGGVGANAISRSMFFRDNNGQFGALGIHIQHHSSAGYAHQIVSSDYSTTELKHRQKHAGTWSAARTILDSGNYNSYALPLTGGTLTGTLNGTSAYFSGNIGVGVSPTYRIQTDAPAMLNRTAFGVLDINSNGSPNFIKIQTAIPFSYQAQAYTVNIKGFAYDSSQTVDLAICWHQYADIFYATALTSKGSFAPTVRLARESGNVVICLTWSGKYWPKLYVESVHNYDLQSYSTGWTWVDADITGDKVVTLSYKNDWGGGMTKDTSGNLTVTGSVTGASFVSGSKQLAPGTKGAWEGWKAVSAAVSASAIGLYGSTGTWLGTFYGDTAAVGFLNSSNNWDLKKSIDGELYATVSGVSRTVLHSGNYSSYSPTLTGGGASGSWAIDITGYAAAVAVSDTRSVATTPQTINRGVVFDFKENSSNGLNDGGNYFGLMTFRQYGVNTDWSGGLSHQLGFTDNGNIWQRSGSNTTWGSWKKLWDDANDGAGSGLDADLLDGQHGSYYAAASSLANYLPLTGGTLTGGLTGTTASFTGDFQSGGAIIRASASTAGHAWLSTAAYGVSQGDGRTHFGYNTGTQYENYIRGAHTVVNGSFQVVGAVTAQSTLAVTGAITQNGNQVLHASNYSSYALPLSGGTLTGELAISTGTSTGLRVNAPSGTQSFWLRVGYDTDGTATPVASALNTMLQSSGSSAGTFTIVCGNTKTATLSNTAANFAVALQQGGNQVLHAGNYNSYAPTLTGTGASGTWGISISGSAVSSTTQSKSDSSTSIATTAFAKWLFATSGTGGTTDWNDVSNTMPGTGTTLLLGSATNGFGPSQYYHPVNFEYAGTGGTGNVTQLAVAYGYNGNDLRMRGRYSGTWTSWVQFLNSSNFSSYALPITGGSVTGPVSIIGQTVNGQSHYQWEGATFRNPGDWTASQIIRRDNATAGINGSIPALVLYNNNGGDQTTVGLSFASAEGATGQGNAVALAGIIARKEGAGTVGNWSSGSLTIYVKNAHTRVDALNITSTGTVNALVALQQDGNQVLHAGNYTSYLNNTYLRAAGHPGYNDWNVFGNTAQTVNSIFQENFNIPTSTGSSNFPTNAAYKYGTLVNFGSGSDARAQVYISHAGNDLVFRGGWGTSSWQTWNRCLTDQNYNSYSPTLNGTGATGTWGISITGTSRGVGTSDPTIGTGGLWVTTATGLNVARNGTAYVVLDSGNYSSYSPPLAQAVYGENATATTNLSENNLDAALKSGFYTVNKVDNSKLPATSTAVNFLIHCSYVGVGNTAGIDLLTQDSTTSNLFYRNATGAGKGAWRTVLDSANYNSYAPTLTGGGASGTWGISISGSAAQLNGQAASYYLNAGNLNAGTLPSARLSGTYTIDIAGASSSGSRLGLWDATAYITGSNTISGTGGRGVNLAPNTYVKQISFEFKNTSFASMGGNYGGLITIAPWDGTAVSQGDPNYQLLFSASAANSTSNPVLRLRAGIDAGWGAWATLIHDANFATAIPNSGVGAGTYNNVTVNAKGIVTGGSNVSYLTGNQSISITGDATGSGTTSISLTLANSGVGAGTYRSVTVDAKGRVTGGTNPTTFSGYGISDIAYGSTGSRNVWTITDWNQTTYQNAHFLSSENTHTNGPTSDYIYGLQTSFHRSGAAYRTQMVTELYSSPVSIWVRNSRDSDVWTTWSKLLHSNNYTDYAPTKTGVGASGSWGINITGSSASCTGNAATATNVAWSGITSKPTTLSGYGITDAINTSATAQTKSGDLTVGGNFVSNGTATVKSNGTRTGTALVKFAQTIGDNYATSFNIDHNLSTGDILVQVVRLADGVIGDFTTSIVAATLNRVTVTFATAPTNSQYRVVVVG